MQEGVERLFFVATFLTPTAPSYSSLPPYSPSLFPLRVLGEIIRVFILKTRPAAAVNLPPIYLPTSSRVISNTPTLSFANNEHGHTSQYILLPCAASPPRTQFQDFSPDLYYCLIKTHRQLPPSPVPHFGRYGLPFVFPPSPSKGTNVQLADAT